MLYLSKGSPGISISESEIRDEIFNVLDKLGHKKRVLVIPPDFTRYHSMAGKITYNIFEYYRENLAAILPALGTHFPMTCGERKVMFGNIPEELFKVHNWRKDLVTLGEVPAEFISKVSEGKVDYPWPAQVNRMIIEGGYDLILSVGQVVPHEVVGMANYNKNVFIGTGGKEGINKSHFLGAVYGMERMMGHIDTPVRKVLNYASEQFASHLPLVYVLTVVGRGRDGNLHLKGLYAGNDSECFDQAASLSLKVNFEMVENSLKKVLVYLDPLEFKSTWLGNKSIYRTRMAIADGGELIIMAPGLKEFGEDPEIDHIIRKYGYQNTSRILQFVNENQDLKNNLGAAAHLIHGSSENRFKITYCPGNLSKEEIESVNFEYAPLNQITEKYNPARLKEGSNILSDGQEVFYISNPALGLWSTRQRFME
jgi:nickel-dependent lactate racemase